MPKKKGKNRKKAKGKGKKDGKPSESKADRETDAEKAKANAALWEARLDLTEQSRTEYREAARRLARANEELNSQQYRTEKDTIDIIAFLKTKDDEKERQIARLEEQLREQKTKAREEKEQLVAEYTLRVTELEEKFRKRSGEFRMIQGELKTIKEFRKKKAQMEQELEDMKEKMFVADREHRECLARLEHKFFCEKDRLEKEAEQRVGQLAERAHNQAIVQLDDTSRSVFKENIRLNEALSYHLREAEELRKTSVALAEENSALALHKETSDRLVKENVSRLRHQREETAELRRKVDSLERALGLMAGKFERERREAERRAVVRTEAGRVEMDKLQTMLGVRERELNRVKLLARGVVEQRTELECFFQEALGQVKQEIQASRMQYRQAAKEAYRHQMSLARAGHQEYPRVRTFSKNEHSTNNVYSDLEEAEKWTRLPDTQVDVSELTWEHKERVLRLLFAKMNGLKARKPIQSLALSEPSKKDQGSAKEPPDTTFITQTPVSFLPKLLPQQGYQTPRSQDPNQASIPTSLP